MARSVETPAHGMFRVMESPFTQETPMRTPVNEPGPAETAMQVTSSSVLNSCPKMSNGTHTIVIKRNSQNQYTYWDVHSDSVRGRSIMDLMQEHLFETTGKMPSLREVGEILQNYINTNRITTPEKSR